MKTPSKALSMTKFVIWLSNDGMPLIRPYKLDEQFVRWTVNYAKFLQTPLNLGQFFPCKDGEPLKKLAKIDYTLVSDPSYTANEKRLEFQEYQQAEERVLFKGCEMGRVSGRIFYNGISVSLNNTIEQLIIKVPDIEITNNYYKQIFK